MALERFFIRNAAQYEGQLVTLKGWVYNKRSSGKKLRFLILRDGTGVIQGILFKGECDENAFEHFEQLTQESSVEVTGVIRTEPRSPGGFELGVRSLKPIHIAHEYPISLKDHGVEFLMRNRHLWIRSSRQVAALKIRSELIKGVHDFFHKEGFVQFDAPILTGNACEGTSTLFSTPYFDQKAYLSQSGQLYAEVGAMAFGRTYVYGPTFRAEKSKTRKHLTEFWMVEPEMAFSNLNDAMELGERFIDYLLKHALEHCADELNTLDRDVSKLKSISLPFPRVSYDDALDIVNKAGLDMKWGEDFGAPHEAAVADAFSQPVFVHHFPADIKAFYFKRSDAIDSLTSGKSGKYALGCDLIAPEGYGEIIGGGQREDDLSILEARLADHDLQAEDYYWYTDLRRYGSVPHSGFGAGIERIVAWISGVSHVRETIPFARTLNTLRP